jgi:hypothetical protein
MSNKIETAIETLTAKIKGDIKPDEALKYTQAALNLAHVVATLEGAKKLNAS